MSKPKLGLVLSGGGSRGAYEAGVIHYLRTMLPQDLAWKRGFDVLCGSSVGGINTCFLAASAHDLKYQGRRVYELWNHLKQEDIYQRDVLSFFRFLYRSFLGISKNIFTKQYDPAGSFRKKHIFRGLFNTSPLIPFLKGNFPWKQISINIENGFFDAITLTATNIATGKLELFIEKRKDLPYTGRYLYHDTKIEYYHAMASAAIPLIFPAVKIKRSYYMDGGVRMNTPVSPAIQLGAEKILVLGVHHEKEGPEYQQKYAHDHFAMPDSPPSMGNTLGTILSTLFLDKLDYDMEQMNRINRLIDWSEGCFGTDYIEKINHYLKEQHIKGDIAARGLKRLKVFKIFPSKDVREIFSESVKRTQFFQKNLTRFEKTLLKVLDVDLESGTDFLSFVMFYPEYLHALLELGFEDARKNHDKLIEFLS